MTIDSFKHSRKAHSALLWEIIVSSSFLKKRRRQGEWIFLSKSYKKIFLLSIIQIVDFALIIASVRICTGVCCSLLSAYQRRRFNVWYRAAKNNILKNTDTNLAPKMGTQKMGKLQYILIFDKTNLRKAHTYLPL